MSAADGTIRPRGSTNTCLQTAQKTEDANVFVGPCSSTAGITPQQKWIPNNGPPSPTPISKQYAGICARATRSGAGLCITLDGKGNWTLADQGSPPSPRAVPLHHRSPRHFLLPLPLFPYTTYLTCPRNHICQ